MSYQDMKKTWRKFKCIFLSKSQHEKSTQYMIPSMWHSGKTMERIKNQWVQVIGGRENKQSMEDYLGQWNYSVWYYNGR